LQTITKYQISRPIKILAHDSINTHAGGIKLNGKITPNSDIFTQSLFVAAPR